MYQVLLADDEPSVLESMKEHIDWEQYGTQVAYTALTGKQAYFPYWPFTIRLSGYSYYPCTAPYSIVSLSCHGIPVLY